jgi:hypothetical protein
MKKGGAELKEEIENHSNILLSLFIILYSLKEQRS